MNSLKDNQPPTLYTIFKTRIGWCGVVKGTRGLRRVFIGFKKRDHILNIIAKKFGNALPKTDSNRELIEKINIYCSGNKTSFAGCKLDWSLLTPFQGKVFRAAMKIPYGTVLTYGELSKTIGYPRSSRAVGNALAKNPFPLIVPCHRIIRGDGKVGGFSAAGGKKLKEKLLGMERE